MKQHLPNILFVVFLIVLGGYLFKKYRIAPEQDVQHLSFIDLEGNTRSLADYKGTAILLNYYASWCGDCRAEFPDLFEAKSKLQDENIVFLAVSDEKESKVRSFAPQLQPYFEVMRLPKPFREMDIFSIPTTYLINTEGEITYKTVGSKDWSSEEMLDKIRENL